MTFKQIERRLNTAIDIFRIKDFYLLKNDVCERSITHKLAEHLQYVIGDLLNVDCEYNRNIEHPSNIKKICILNLNINELRNSNSENVDVSEVSVYPDIIVHKRETNSKNTLAIEVKKSTSNIDNSFDFLKLKCYTDNVSANNELKYNYGVFIRFIAKRSEYIKPDLTWFCNGQIIYPLTK